MALRLDRLQRGEKITAEGGVVNQFFQSLWQRVMEQVEKAFVTQQEQITAIALAQAAANAANLAATAASTAAATATTAAGVAQAAAIDAGADASLASSGASGLTMSATDAGASATITISAHTRVYGNGTSVAVSGGSVTGLSYSTGYYIYYVQASRLGGAVTYQATTNSALAAQTGDTHSLGAVTTPAAAGAPIDGNINLPPGVREP